MRVVILGGYGVFGSLLAQLLTRDSHEIWIAGRNLKKARRFAEEIGGTALYVDLKKDPAAIFAAAPNIVIDAAGPFQTYEGDPYLIARLCIAHDADYFDLSDDATFANGITALNDEAVAAGRRIISGASSVPGLSSSIVSNLAVGFDELLSIETAIFPGNRAPRGRSVISSIVCQVGHASKVWRGGTWRDLDGWTDRRSIEIFPGEKRSAYFVHVPDIHLFPAFFDARSVMFRAGMELKLMNVGLRALAFVRRYFHVPTTSWLLFPIHLLSNLLLPFGTDRGGMIVSVTGMKEKTPWQRQWRLVAEAGSGPFIPGIAIRTLLRRLDRIAAGARPCIVEFNKHEAEDAMSDITVSTQTTEGPRLTLFQTALGDRWNHLPPTVQRLHSVQDIESFSGTATVERGSSTLARLAAWFFRFPKAGTNVPITITKMRTENGEIWERNFAGRVFRSYCTQSNHPYRYKERFWLFNYEQELPVNGNSMYLPVRRGWILGIPIPKVFLPTSDSKEYESAGVFHFDVGLGAPLSGGLIVRYRGSLHPDCETHT